MVVVELEEGLVVELVVGLVVELVFHNIPWAGEGYDMNDVDYHVSAFHVYTHLHGSHADDGNHGVHDMDPLRGKV